MRLSKDTPLWQTTSSEVYAWKLDRSVPEEVVTRSEKETGEQKAATSPYWADELLEAIVMKVRL
jgi:hypothetical protein